MDCTAAAETAEDLSRTFAELAVRLRGGGESPGTCDPDPGPGPDPLRRRADQCLEALATVSRADAMMAALKVHAAGGYDEAARLIAGPVTSPQEQSAQEMSTVAEVACALTVSERTGSALLSEAHRYLLRCP